MMELINRQALLDAYDVAHKGPPGGARKLIQEAPTVDAEPVRHGHWINIWDENDSNTSTFGRCTKCNEISKRPLGRYCRWCGAKMDEVSK